MPSDSRKGGIAGIAGKEAIEMIGGIVIIVIIVIIDTIGTIGTIISISLRGRQSRSLCFQRIGDEQSFRSRGMQQSASSNHS